MNKRLQKINGNLGENDFTKILKQIEGRGVLLVVVLNRNCPDCEKIQLFINSLQEGLIKKLANLVCFYGYSEQPLDQADDIIKAYEIQKRKAGKSDGEDKKKKQLTDSNIFTWDLIPEGHGYAIYTGPTDCMLVRTDFDHSEFASNVIDTIRRFASSIRTLPGLAAKKKFLENKGTAIIVETTGASAASKVSALEQEIAQYKGKIKVPIYFCKGLGEEITYFQNGQAIAKVKGFKFSKLIKELPVG